jgi:hypothetical protein
MQLAAVAESSVRSPELCFAARPHLPSVQRCEKQTSRRPNPVTEYPRPPFARPQQPSGGQQPQKLPNFGADTPLGRPGQPAELAPIYVLLASHESSCSTGQVFGAVGGRGGP